jgi:hypothetical protein
MIMQKDINDFFSFQTLKNGKIKISIRPGNKIKIYEALKENGYRKGIFNKKRIYFKREEDNIKELQRNDLTYAFYKLLKNWDIQNLPKNIKKSDCLDIFIEQDPIKENKLFNYFLSETLSESDFHNLRLQNDVDYKHKFEIDQMLSKFMEWSFQKSKDSIGAFIKNAPMYHKGIGNNQYIVFLHYNFKKKGTQGFDCYLATYKKQENIGITHPSEIKQIRLSFNLESDYPLIKNYL